jgi:hypothetical protein
VSDRAVTLNSPAATASQASSAPPPSQATRDLRTVLDLIDYEQLPYRSLYANHAGWHVTVFIDTDDELAAWARAVAGRVQPLHGGARVSLMLRRLATDADRARLRGAS